VDRRPGGIPPAAALAATGAPVGDDAQPSGVDHRRDGIGLVYYE